MDDVAIAYWASVAAGGPVVGLALVIETRWVQSQWTRGLSRWVRGPWAAFYGVVALGIATSSGYGLARLAAGTDADRWPTTVALACGLGLVLLTPIFAVVSDGFKREDPRSVSGG